MTKEFVPLGPGWGDVPLGTRGAGLAVDQITANPEDGSMTVGLGAEAWALPMGVLPGVVAVALAAVMMRGEGMTIGVPSGVIAFAWAVAATVAALLLGGGEEDRGIVASLRESWV